MIDEKKVKEHFNKAAQRHSNENAVLDSAIGKEVAFANLYRNYFNKRYIRKYFSPRLSDVVLDFGCGVGRISFFLSPFVKKIQGVDVSEKMVQTAKEKAAGYTNVDFTLLESKNLPLDSGQFDKVISNWVLQHISDEDCKTYLREFYRVLKPGGKIFLFEQVKNAQQIAADIHIFRTAEQYDQLITESGFKKVTAKPVMRVPARGMSLWNKFNINSKILLWFFSLIDDMTINRKPQLADYFTYVFVYEKQ